MDYTIEIFKVINNPYYNFYKLSINGICQFDEFVKEVETISQEHKSLVKILNLMDAFSPTPLPKTLFRQIVPKNKKERPDIFEFKRDTLRIYVILQKPNVYIVRGGRKKTQEQDIALVKKETKEFNS